MSINVTSRSSPDGVQVSKPAESQPEQQQGMRLYEGPRTGVARRPAPDDDLPTLYLIAFKDHSIVQALGYCRPAHAKSDNPGFDRPRERRSIERRAERRVQAGEVRPLHAITVNGFDLRPSARGMGEVYRASDTRLHRDDDQPTLYWSPMAFTLTRPTHLGRAAVR
jgi:hypothetical protein